MSRDITSHNIIDELGDRKNAVGAALQVNATTAELAAIGNAINTTGKYIGKQVFNTTTKILVVAVTAAAGGVWANAGTGVTAHTPV